MALNLHTSYNATTEVGDTDHPYGRAKNSTSPSALDGFPGDKDWFNDQQGFFQALLSLSGQTPSGSIDTVLASQYLAGAAQLFGGSIFVTDTGVTDNVYVVDTNGGGYSSLFEGLRVLMKTTRASTSVNPTLTVDSLAAKTIVQEDGSALVKGQIKAGYNWLVYDGTNFYLVDQQARLTNRRYIWEWSNLKAAVDEIAGDGNPDTQIVIDRTVSETATYTVPSNIHIAWEKTGKLSVSSGNTVTITSMNRPQHKVFDGDGSVAFAGGHTVGSVLPQWWGGVNSVSVDNAAALQAAIDSLPSEGGTIDISGMMGIGSSGWTGINFTGKTNIEFRPVRKGAGFKVLYTPTQYLSQGTFAVSVFLFDTSSLIKFEGLNINMNSITANGLGLSTVTDSEFAGNYIYGNTAATDVAGIMTQFCSRNVYRENRLYDSYHGMILGRSGYSGSEENDYSVIGNYFWDQTNASLNVTGLRGKIEGNHIYNCGMDSLGLGAGTSAVPTVSHEVEIIGNIIVGGASQGINLEHHYSSTSAEYNITISQNTIVGCGGPGVWVDQAKYASITDNRIIDCGTTGTPDNGITVVRRSTATGADSTKKLNITGNTIGNTTSGASRTTNYGVYISTGTSVANTLSEITVSGNNVFNVLASGIAAIVQSSPAGTGANLNIFGNTIVDCVAWGVTINGPWSSGLFYGNIVRSNDTGTGTGNVNFSSSVTPAAFTVYGNDVDVPSGGSQPFTFGSPQQVNNQKIWEGDTSGTTLAYQTFDLPTNSAVKVEASTVAVMSDGSNRAAYDKQALIYRQASIAAIQGSEASIFAQESDASWDFAITVNSNSYRVGHTGGTGQTISWKTYLTTKVSAA